MRATYSPESVFLHDFMTGNCLKLHFLMQKGMKLKRFQVTKMSF